MFQFGIYILEFRKQERCYLEKSAYALSITNAMIPSVPILTAIVTFLVHIAAGNNLTAAQVCKNV